MASHIENSIVTAKDVFGKEYAVDKFTLIWRPSVYGIVINGDKVLLSPQFGDRFDLPGGGVDLGEDLEKAVVREVKEETGIDVEVVKLAGVKSNLFMAIHSNDKSAYHSILIYYVCRKVGGELSTAGFDEYEKQYAALAKWVPLSGVDSIKVASTVDYRDLINQQTMS